MRNKAKGRTRLSQSCLGLTLRYGKTAIDCDVGFLPGGHNDFERRQKSIDAIEHFKSIYPWMTFKKTEGKTWDFEPVLKGKFYGFKAIKNIPLQANMK